MKRGDGSEWEELAQTQPFYAVLTQERFLNENLDADALDEFFASGERDVASLFGDRTFNDALDFGCGAGRLTLALARRSQRVVGVDISPTMLALAKRHSEKMSNVDFAPTLESLRARTFDCICSLIVFQHIAVADGERLLGELLALARPGATIAIQFTFARAGGATKRFARKVRASSKLIHRATQIIRREKLRIPYMQMNEYDRERIAAIFENAHCSITRTIPTDHGGIAGAILIARKD